MTPQDAVSNAIPRRRGRPFRPAHATLGVTPLILAAALAACGGGAAGPGAGQGIAVGEPTPGSAPTADALGIIQQAIRAQLAQKAYKVSQTSTSQNGTIESEIVFVAPDRYQMTTRLPITGADAGGTPAGETTRQFIMIGDQVWTRLNDKWVKSDAMGAAAKSLVDGLKSQYGDWEKGITDLQSVGAEPVGGQPAHIYTYTSSLKMGEDSALSQVKLWLRDADGLPVHVESVSAFGGFMTQTTQDITYDDSLTVEPPAGE